MVDIDKVRSLIAQSGMTTTYVAREIGVDRATLYNRYKGIGEFTASEIAKLTQLFHLSTKERDEIFFATKVPPDETNKNES